MTKHKLDEEVEDILLHYGIKGMKWGKRKESSESAEDGAAGGGGSEEEEEGLLDELGDKFENLKDALGTKMKNINKNVKKAGYNMLVKIFGKAKNRTITEVTVNGVTRAEYQKRKGSVTKKKYPADIEMEKVKNMTPAQKKALQDKWTKNKSKRPAWSRIY